MRPWQYRPWLVRCVVPGHEGVKVGLYFLKALVELLAKGYFVKLFLHRLVKPLDAPVGLRMPGLRLRVLDPVQVQEKLVGVRICSSAVLWAAVSQDAKDAYPMFVVEGQYLVV